MKNVMSSFKCVRDEYREDIDNIVIDGHDYYVMQLLAVLAVIAYAFKLSILAVFVICVFIPIEIISKIFGSVK